MFDIQFKSSTITTKNTPFSSVYIIRNRRAVQDEGGLNFGTQMRDLNYDHYRLINNAGTVDLDNASGIGTFQQLEWILVEDNGATSRIYVNGVQLGTDKTLSASNITALYYGTNSHQWEHDLFFAGNKYGIFTAPERAALGTLINSFFTVDQRPQAPHLYDPVIAFDGTDTYTISSVQWYDPNSIAENTALREYEWFLTDTGVASLQGWTGLDAQTVVSRKSTLKRSEIPQKFNGRCGAGTLNVCLRIKGYNTSGVGYTGIPYRSRLIIDNVAGTPVATGQAWINSVKVDNATPTMIEVGFTSTAGGGTLSGGNINHFHVFKNGTEVNISSIDLTQLGSSKLFLTLGSAITSLDFITVTHTPDATTPLQNSLSFIIPLMQTGAYLAFVNNVVGAKKVKGNISFGVNANDPQYVNLDTNGSIATLSANMNNIFGVASGYSCAVTNAFQGITDVSIPGFVGTLFDDSQVNQRGLEVWQGGDGSGTVRIAGLTANQVFDIQLPIYHPANGGTGTISVQGNSQGFTATTYTEFSWTSLTADASGNIDIVFTISQSGKSAAWMGFILTTYP
jgi:hypothetical protein